MAKSKAPRERRIPTSEYVLERTPSFIDPEVVYGFIGSILSPRFDKLVKSPPFHYELLTACCKDIKREAHAAPRDHAKSSVITIGLVLACALFRKKQNIMLVADTSDQAEQFLHTIKTELTENEELREMFGVIGLAVDNEKEIICLVGSDRHIFRIFAKGAGQSLRGSTWKFRRPDFIVCDDMENDEMVDNPNRRLKLKKWVMATLLPILAKGGHIRFVGTVLHADSLLENLLQSPKWYSLRHEACDEHFENVLWPDKYSKQDLIDIYEDYKELGQADVFAREYRNIPVDESTALIRSRDLKEYDPDNPDHRIIEYILSVDLAISKDELADESAFGIIGVTTSKNLVLYDCIHERLDSGEIIDKLFELQATYRPTSVFMEAENISRTLGSLLYDEMTRRGIYMDLTLVPHGNKDLIKRSTPIRNIIKAGGLLFNKEEYWWESVEAQLLHFPRGKRDDVVAMLALVGLKIMDVIEPVSPEEIEEEEAEDVRMYGYEDEYYDDEYALQGISEDTGY